MDVIFGGVRFDGNEQPNNLKAANAILHIDIDLLVLNTCVTAVPIIEVYPGRVYQFHRELLSPESAHQPGYMQQGDQPRRLTKGTTSMGSTDFAALYYHSNKLRRWISAIQPLTRWVLASK